MATVRRISDSEGPAGTAVPGACGRVLVADDQPGVLDAASDGAETRL